MYYVHCQTFDVQGDQLYTAAWPCVSGTCKPENLTCPVCTLLYSIYVHYRHFLQGTRTTRPGLSGCMCTEVRGDGLNVKKTSSLVKPPRTAKSVCLSMFWQQ